MVTLHPHGKELRPLDNSEQETEDSYQLPREGAILEANPQTQSSHEMMANPAHSLTATSWKTLS